jgi:hypothetical protein
MKKVRRFLMAFTTGFLLVASASAQAKLPAPTRNAALRYWQAFSELKDEQTDKGTRELLEKTAAGESPWNEVSLGKILDANLHAIQIMQKATNLPECDWGLEPTSDEPVGFVYKARVLARLNTLQGMRLAAKGDSEGAVSAWVAGVKFSQDLARGGSLIFLLVGRAALLSDLNALKKAGDAGSLDLKARSTATAALTSLPATGFDWGSAWEMETASVGNGWQAILKSKNPRAKYRELMGEELNGSERLPTTMELGAFVRFMDEVASALRVPPMESRAKLAALREREKTLNPLLQSVIPNFEKTNTAREEVQTARDEAIKALRNKS